MAASEEMVAAAVEQARLELHQRIAIHEQETVLVKQQLSQSKDDLADEKKTRIEEDYAKQLQWAKKITELESFITTQQETQSKQQEYIEKQQDFIEQQKEQQEEQKKQKEEWKKKMQSMQTLIEKLEISEAQRERIKSDPPHPPGREEPNTYAPGREWEKRFDKDLKPSFDLVSDPKRYDEWRKKMVGHFGSGDRRLCEVLKWAEGEKKSITDQALEEAAQIASMGLEELKQWDFKIANALSGKTSGESHRIVSNANNGADAWRALATRWAPRNMQRAWDLKKRCHNIGKASGYTDLSVKVETVKQYIREYQECSGESLGDECHKMILQMVCHDRVSEELRLKGFEDMAALMK